MKTITFAATTERPMSDKLVTRSGESVEINSVIEALEAAPDKAEILDTSLLT